MKIGTYNNFIIQNVAPYEATRIGVYNSSGKRFGGFMLQNLRLPRLGKKLYSIGVVSDIHITYSTAVNDLKMAIEYFFNKEKVDFVGVSGDLTGSGTSNEFTTFLNTIGDYRFEFSLGNHDTRSGLADAIEDYTGKPLYYSFEHGNDVFIFFGNRVEAPGKLFSTESLQWLYNTLEKYRNKRCFLFQHVRPQDGCGNALGIYTYDIWGGTEQIIFESMMKHYKNVIHFHGHSHLKFHMQQYSNIANIDKIFGSWSIHVPSLTVPRDTESIVNPSIKEVYADSEGYVVDVYRNHIILRGRDFIKEEFLPIATYCLNTKPVEIEPNTFVDPTGTLIIN